MKPSPNGTGPYHVGAGRLVVDEFRAISEAGQADVVGVGRDGRVWGHLPCGLGRGPRRGGQATRRRNRACSWVDRCRSGVPGANRNGHRCRDGFGRASVTPCTAARSLASRRAVTVRGPGGVRCLAVGFVGREDANQRRSQLRSDRYERFDVGELHFQVGDLSRPLFLRSRCSRQSRRSGCCAAPESARTSGDSFPQSASSGLKCGRLPINMTDSYPKSAALAMKALTSSWCCPHKPA